MKKNKGFTLIELLVVIAIIGILSGITLVVLDNTKNKGNIAKVQAQLKGTVNQSLLFTTSTDSTFAYITPDGNSPTSDSIPGAASGGTKATGVLFNDTDSASNSLYSLMSKLPLGSTLYYGWDGQSTLTGGKYFIASGTRTGAICVDYTGLLSTYKGTMPKTTSEFKEAFPSANVTLYSCATTIIVPPPTPKECNDGDDNDGDKMIDDQDPECLDRDGIWYRQWDSETFDYDPETQKTQCEDGEDNDGDDKRDEKDPECLNRKGEWMKDWISETIDVDPEVTQCNDRDDNDGDDKRDEEDPECHDKEGNWNKNWNDESTSQF